MTTSARSWWLVVVFVGLVSLVNAEEPEQKKQPLFDGKTLKGWKVTDFAGHGDVRVEDGRLMLGFGADLTGVTWKRPFPKTNYEISLEAQRVDGTDFFCGLTFPVGKSACSFILGGWGGGVVGLSCIDGYDASENETTTFEPLESGRWYRVRVRVNDERIQVWLDDKSVVNVPRAGKRFSVRDEVELSQPLGIASWQTTAAIRKFGYRVLKE